MKSGGSLEGGTTSNPTEGVEDSKKKKKVKEDKSKSPETYRELAMRKTAVPANLEEAMNKIKVDTNLPPCL